MGLDRSDQFTGIPLIQIALLEGKGSNQISGIELPAYPLTAASSRQVRWFNNRSTLAMCKMPSESINTGPR